MGVLFTQEQLDRADDPIKLELTVGQRVADLKQEIQRRLRSRDGALWAKEKLGDTLWSGQRRIIESVAKHRRTAVPSCHEVGKSYTASVIVGWWLDKEPVGHAFVVTSAPTEPQVRAILWREIGRVHARGNLRGRLNQTEWYMTTPLGKEELVAFGRKPSDYDPTAFQGIHAPKVLVILDEACGIPDLLWEAADSLIANDDSKIVVFGNPDDPQTEFHNVCRPGSGWNVVPISAFDSPNFTGEPMPPHVLKQLIGKLYVEEKRRKWAPRWFWVNKEGQRCEPEDGVRCVCPEGDKPEDTNPLWQSKVLGKFPERSDAGGLIPMSWIRAAQERTLVPAATDDKRLGVDVGAGGDASVIGELHGPVFRVRHEDHNPDTMQTAGNVLAQLRATGARVANIDDIGIGKGVQDRLNEQKTEAEAAGEAHKFPWWIIGINVGLPAWDTEHFVNLRAELYWRLRERFEAGQIDIDPADEDLAGELAELRYRRLSNGKIQIESKEDMKRRKVPSPNRAESMMLANANMLVEEEWDIQ